MEANNEHSPEQPDPSAPTGGIGGQPVIDPRTGAKDMRLLRSAIRKGWNVPDHLRQLVVQEMGLVVGARRRDGRERDVSDRDRIAAARVLVAADQVDARREAAEIQQPAPSVNVSVEVNAIAHVLQELARDQVEEKIYEGIPPAAESNGVQRNGKHE